MQKLKNRDKYVTNPEGELIISVNLYNCIIGMCLIWGFGLNVVLVKTCYDFVHQIGIIPFTIGYFLSALIGIILSRTSDSAGVSFLGYNMVVVPIGLMLSVALEIMDYPTDVIFRAMYATAIICAVMMVASMLAPHLFCRLGPVLALSLMCLIIVEFAMIWLGVTVGFIDWLAVGIFALYIGYDWYFANTIEPTVDNAVDICVDLYLDIINLFLRILAMIAEASED